MSSTSSFIAVLFADISGSTRIFESLGDLAARHKITQCLDLLGDVVAHHHGTLVKTIGDEVMCTFPSAEEAASAASAMQDALEDTATEYTASGRVSLRIRVGFHYGPAVVEHNDVFGDTVNIAARMVSLAKAGQIITTQQTIEMLSANLRSSARFVDRVPVKGKKQTIDICELLWQQEDVTRLASNVVLSGPAEAQMHLNYRDRSISVNPDRPAVMLGRSNSADVTVDETLASRQHAKIEYRKGKFYIVDQSTNGTFIRTDDGTESFLRREEVPLTGSGVISLGKAFKQLPTEIVRYRTE
ncbi:MAG: adenylate/guanylate cyclase domain-containing protein [Chromatiales bacterium]